MDTSWLLIILTLIVLFVGISVVGALLRIRNASERTVELLEEQLSRQDAR